MKKFQEWQQNQIYLQHLNRLSSIKQRKRFQTQSKLFKRVQSAGNFMEMQYVETQNKRLIDSIKNPRRQIDFKPIKVHKKQKSTLKKFLQQKFLAYQNYLFGKRILQTNPVISKKQLDKQYKIHKKTLKTMCKTKNQYKQQVQQKFNQYINTASSVFFSGQGSNILTLKFLDTEFYKYKLSDKNFSDISLELNFNGHIVRSQFVHVNELIGHEFILRFKKKYLKQNKILIHLKYNKGNSDIQLGYFQIQIQQYLQNSKNIYKKVEKKQTFKRIGTPAGFVEYEITIERKRN